VATSEQTSRTAQPLKHWLRDTWDDMRDIWGEPYGKALLICAALATLALGSLIIYYATVLAFLLCT
jgi:hypothetical protein